jgi:carbonic anhydrase
VHDKHNRELKHIKDDHARLDRLCELNVLEQVVNIGQTNIVQDAWSMGQDIAIHGCIYSLRDGVLRDLDTTVTDTNELNQRYQQLLSK